MSVNKFIPEVWSARLLKNLHKVLVFAQTGIINRNYEGEINSVGDTVKINAIGVVTISDYTKNTNLSDPEELQDAQTVLTITQSKSFNFQVDDIDQFQQKPKIMDDAMQEAAYGLRNVADQFVSGLYTGVAPANTTGLGDDTTPVVPSATTAYEYLVDMSVLLDEANIPPEGRWVVVPPWYEGRLLKDDRFVKYGQAGAEARLANGTLSGGLDSAPQNGYIGRAAGFNVYKSNNCPTVANANLRYKIIAGHPGAWTYAEQIRKVEAYRPEKRFADAVKGLHLYGAKLVRPNSIAVMTATKA